MGFCPLGFCPDTGVNTPITQTKPEGSDHLVRCIVPVEEAAAVVSLTKVPPVGEVVETQAGHNRRTLRNRVIPGSCFLLENVLCDVVELGRKMAGQHGKI